MATQLRKTNCRHSCTYDGKSNPLFLSVKVRSVKQSRKRFVHDNPVLKGGGPRFASHSAVFVDKKDKETLFHKCCGGRVVAVTSDRPRRAALTRNATTGERTGGLAKARVHCPGLWQHRSRFPRGTHGLATFEWIEDSNVQSLEISLVSRGNNQVMYACRGSDHCIFE